jgi:cytidylate kinase
MIVTIDGPAGAGKSSVARQLATRLGFRFLDTGAMYRAVTLAAIESDVNLHDAEAVVRLAHRLTIELDGQFVLVDGCDVTDRLRSMQVTKLSRHVADNPGVRARLVQLQRRVAAGLDVVTEGRDQGTVVFPDAECKIFLTATAAERARRRHRDLVAAGQDVPYDEVLAQQEERDRRDRARAVGPLVAAADAIEFVTDDLTQDEVVDRLEALARRRAAE